jgi:hypothetical protein
LNKNKVVNITQIDIYEKPLYFAKHWDKFLLSLLHHGEIVLHHYPNIEMINGLDKLGHESVSKLHHKSLFNDSGFKIVIDTSDNAPPEDLSLDRAIHIALHKAMEILLIRGFVEKGEWAEAPFVGDFKYAYAMETYVLTPKGIDVALKLQEHEDNERRHGVTTNNSNKAFWVSVAAITVSVGALIAASLSAYLNFERLELYEVQIENMTSNQADILKSVKQSTVLKIENATNLQSSVAQIKEKH